MHVLTSLPFIRSVAAVWDDPESRALIVIAAVQIAGGTLIFWWIEDWNLVESLYFCVVSSTTVGYGDFTPSTDAGRIITIFYLIMSVGLVVALLSRIATGRVERRASAIERREERAASPEA